MASKIVVNGRNVTGWRKYPILVPATISAVGVCVLTYLALIPLAIFFLLFLIPVALLSAVLSPSRGEHE